MPDRSLHHNIEPAQRDAAARRCVAIYDQQSAATGRARRLRRIALHVHATGHHVLGQARSGIAVHRDMRVLVHTGAVIADMAVDGDAHVAVEPARKRMRTARVADEEIAAVGVMQELVHLAQ